MARVEAEREDARAQCDNLALELQLARADNEVLKVKNNKNGGGGGWQVVNRYICLL